MSDMTKEELEAEVSRLRKQIKDENPKSEIEQCREELEADAGEIDGGTAELSILFPILALPFLMAAGRYRSKARKAMEANDLTTMRMYTDKAKAATRRGKFFAEFIMVAAVILFFIGVFQIFSHIFKVK